MRSLIFAGTFLVLLASILVGGLVTYLIAGRNSPSPTPSTLEEWRSWDAWPGARPAEILPALYAGADDTDWRLPETLQGMFISGPSYSASAGMSAGVGHAGSERTWAVPRCARTVARVVPCSAAERRLR